MSNVGQRERETQNRVVKLFENQIGYEYLGNWEERNHNKNIEEELLGSFLKETQGYSTSLINKAIFELHKTAGDQTKNLYDVNKEVYRLLRYGVKVREMLGLNTETVWLIDWKNPERNHFAIAEEVTVKSKHDKRPDIVLYVNGIALGVIELKRSTVSITEGIRQNLDNQTERFIKPFFHTMQLVMAGNDTEGLRYATIDTPEKYYLSWKETDRDKYGHLLDQEMVAKYDQLDNQLDKHLIQVCDKKRLIELFRDFIVYDRGIKKIARPNQYFGVQAAQKFIKRREGGIVWHTQGSGKSLTMVWLAKWIRENINNARVLIITDRDELDKQIEKVFIGVDEEIHRTKSGHDLIEKLDQAKPWLIASLIHKFGRKEDADYDEYIADIRKSLPKNFKPKGDIYIFVDECHRTQSGKLHQAMKEIMPNALMIGFTGTPLLKKDKETSIETFGPYIHTYKFDEAVHDQVVLDLRYEARNIDQYIRSQDKIDRWFEAKTKGLTDYAKADLKRRWGNMQRVLSSRERLDQIVADIMFDLETKDRLQNGRGNAMLVSGSIYQACRYYELFQNAGLKKCAIITSYNPNISDVKGESTGEGSPTDRLKQYEVYQKMLNGKSPEDFEDEVKKKFVEEPGQMKLLIVVDKLLTGFDAPSATYLYIDKSMRDHGLFQAICRVNRLDGDDKEYGYVIDYKDLFKSLEKSFTDYTSEAFDSYDTEDVRGLLSDRLAKGKERLDQALESIRTLCEPVTPPKDTQDYIRYFCGRTEYPEELKDTEQSRLALYKYTASLLRAYANLANEMEEAGYSAQEVAEIKDEVKHYENVRQEIKLVSGDYIDLKAYEPAMRHLIDTYIGAEESKSVSAFDDMSLIDLLVERGKDAVDQLLSGIKRNQESVAETIENNLRRVIIDERPTNPQYYERMSVLLDELIRLRKQKAQEYEEYLAQIVELSRKVKKPQSSSSYPSSLNSAGKRALYDNLGQDEELALAVHKSVMRARHDEWRGHRIKERKIKHAIEKHVPDEERATKIFDILRNQHEY